MSTDAVAPRTKLDRVARGVGRAKVDTMELFALVLNTQPRGSLQGYGEDIAWKLEREIQSMDAEKTPPPR